MLKKHIFITALLATIAIPLSKIGIDIAASLLSTLFTVNGIMFSIGLGLIANFNMNGVKNKSYIASIRSNVQNVRNVFMLLFFLSSCSFLASLLIDKPISVVVREHEVFLDLALLSIIIIVYSTVYFIDNFLAIQKLNDEIFDRLLEENP